MVNLDALVVAFDDSEPARSYYLDRDTGTVFNFLEDHDAPETQEMAWQIEVDGGRRFIQIPKLSIEEELQEQDSFVETIEDQELKLKLSQMLETDHDGSRFQDFVSRQREVREKWRSFCRVRSRERASDWLGSLGLKAT
jgi:hypothetical protein